MTFTKSQFVILALAPLSSSATDAPRLKIKSTTKHWMLVLDGAAEDYPPPGGAFPQTCTRT